MLQFILGKSGTGKSEWINNKIREMILNNEDKIILLVPDQSTFEAEKALLKILGAKDCKKVLVMGFSRLCSYVFEQTGNIPKNAIDDGTRSVIMSVALEQLTEKLNLLKPSGGRALVDVMLKTLTDCKKSNISTDMLILSAQSVEDDTLKTKLNETALIFDSFDALVSQSYIDPLDDLTRAYNILLENFIFDGYKLFIDSFSGFNAQQQKVLKLLIENCEQVYITLTLDPLTDGREDVFATSQQTYKALKNIAKSGFVKILPPVKLCDNMRFENNELAFLEGSVYRNDSEKSDLQPQNISVFAAPDTYGECDFAARAIKRLVVEQGYLYSDFTVICHDSQPYRGVLNTAFEKYEIPYFFDLHKDISVKPVIRLVSSIFKIIINDFERDDVLSLLKTGLTQNTADEISVFENYLFVWNINRSAFKNEFKQNPRGFAENMSDNDVKSLKTAEKVRLSVIAPLLEFKENIKAKNCKEITELLYNLLCEMSIPEALGDMFDLLEKGDEKGSGAEQIRIWNLLMEVLDKTAASIGEMNVTVKRYYELLSMQIDSIDFSDIPRTLDSVTVTTAQRVRLSKQKTSFLIGCVDGQFPSAVHSGGIFSPYELKMLENCELNIGDSFSDTANLETFMAYTAMTSPSEKLYLSYPSSDLQGSAFLPSSIITETMRTFPNMTALDSADFLSPTDFMWSKQSAFEEWAKNLSFNNSSLNSIEEYFSEDEKYSSKLNAVKRAKECKPFLIENPDNAEALFGRNMRISATRIEKFSLCRFAYFCNYGLNIKPRRKAEIDPLEYGTLVHYILERFFKTYDKEQYSKMTDEQIRDFTSETLSEYINRFFGGEDSHSKSFLYKLEILRQNISVLLRHICCELSQSEFEVADCELQIGEDIPAYTIKLPTGQSIAVCGLIDRADIMKTEDGTYLRIVDYKTGPKKFRLSDVLYGLNLQMLLYLHCLDETSEGKYGEITPAGILYMPATVPIISADKTITESKLDNELDKKLQMNGLLLDDVKVIKGMEKSGEGKYIPVKIKQDMPSSLRSLATLEQFGKIFKKIDLTIAEMGRELYGGNIEAKPVKGAHDACEYCPYDSVCAYRLSGEHNTFDIPNDEVFKAIDSQLKDEGGEG